MNILYILQQSIYGNDGKWKTADSNVNMMLDFVSQMYDIDNSVHFYVLIGKINTFSDIQNFSEIYNRPNVTFIEYPFVVDAFLNRYTFDAAEFLNMYIKLPFIDIVWNNICELTRNIKTTLYANKYMPKYITCNYWLDAPMINQEKVDPSISYDWRQLDGFECSDLCVFTCESTRNTWIENAKYKFKTNVITSILDKSVIWDFGYSAEKVNIGQNTYNFDKCTILFLNRLSGINYTHHKEFINAVNELYEERQDFQVVFTNPSSKFSKSELASEVKPLFSIDILLSRNEYFNLLKSGHISCHLFIKELYGGCSHREAVEAGLLAIVPNVNEYSRIHGNEYEYYVNDDMSNLKDVLNSAIDDYREYKQKKYYNDIINRNRLSSFEYITRNSVYKVLKLLVNG